MTDNPLESYFKEINSLFSEIRETQTEAIKQAAELVSNSIKEGGVIHVFGTGHSSLLARELFFRAGSLAPINFVLDVSITGTVAPIKSSYLERIEGIGDVLFDHARPQEEDSFIVISNSGRNAVPIEFAMKASKEGYPVIAITSKTYSLDQPSRHTDNKRLLDIGDIVIDNCGKIGDIAVEFDEMEQGVGATSTIAGSYILNAIVVQTADRLIDKGIEPPIFKSGNLEKGMEFNQKLIEKYRDRIRNW